jgi:hypothetical protein
MATQPKAKAPAFSDILQTPMSSIEPPKPVPSGHYIVMVLGPPPEEQTASTGTRYLQWNLQYMAAEDDVDMPALQAALTKGDGTVMALREKTVRSERYWITEQAKFRLKKFFNDLGIEDKDEDDNERTLQEAVAMTPGRQLRVHITHTMRDDSVYANVTQTSPVT